MWDRIMWDRKRSPPNRLDIPSGRLAWLSVLPQEPVVDIQEARSLLREAGPP